jgi:hypothetical protein
MVNVDRNKTKTLLSPKVIDSLVALGICFLLVILLVGGLVLAISSMDKQDHEYEAKWNQKFLDEQIADIKSGRTKCVTFYCTSGTDGLLIQLSKVPEVEKITFDLTDVTDDGMKSLAVLVNLKYLRIYGASVSDQGFSYLKDATNLEHLELVNTQITDKSLPILKNMKNLTFLALSHDAKLGSTFTEAGLDNLKLLTKIKTLYLCGGWASKTAIQDLQNALPNCTISTKNDNLML